MTQGWNDGSEAHNKIREQAEHIRLLENILEGLRAELMNLMIKLENHTPPKETGQLRLPFDN